MASLFNFLLLKRLRSFNLLASQIQKGAAVHLTADGWTWHHKSQLLCTLNSSASQGSLPFTCQLNFPKQKFRTWIFQLKSPPTLQRISFSICLQRVFPHSQQIPFYTCDSVCWCLWYWDSPTAIHCTWSFLSFNSLTAREKEQDT